MSAANRRDAIVIGGGPQRARRRRAISPGPGSRVLVLERRYLVGGACVTEETLPGFKVSTAAYVNSLFRQEIIRDLRARPARLRGAAAQPLVVHALPGRPLAHARAGPALNDREIAKFARGTPTPTREYEAMLERVAAFIEPTLTA